jgi:hypothetical protein
VNAVMNLRVLVPRSLLVGLLGSNAMWTCRKHFSPEDGDSMFLQNIGVCLQVHMVLLPRRPSASLSP